LGQTVIKHGKLGLDGTCAYVSQQAWIFHASVRDNIVYGMNWNEAKYNKGSFKNMTKIEGVSMKSLYLCLVSKIMLTIVQTRLLVAVRTSRRISKYGAKDYKLIIIDCMEYRLSFIEKYKIFI